MGNPEPLANNPDDLTFTVISSPWLVVSDWKIVALPPTSDLLIRQSVQWSSLRYPSKTHIKLKSREILFVRNSDNTPFSCPIVLKFYKEYGNIPVVLCAKC